ncbi:30S ribosomal protein S1 [Haliangium sp.]|uniref:30S ribosomal protein S1 n=1 Tax=Haliangium sp. TaxID=2663208 RepID=UPI003D151C19
MNKSEQEENFAALLDEYEPVQPTPVRRDEISVGDRVRGRVVSVGSEAVFVELGTKAEAMLERDQVTDADGQVTVAIGDEIEARVVDMRGATPVLRVSAGRGPDARAELAQAHAHGLPVEGVVSAAVKGGVEVQVAGLRAFCPVSQLDQRFVEDATEFVGQKLEFRIIRYETERKNPNIVLSRRVLLEEATRAQAEETRTRLHPGAVMRGTVTTMKPFGAFVDLGGIEGMVHVSEIGFGRVEHPSDVLHQGQEVEVQVLRIEQTGDKKRPERIALSLRALAEDPWDDAVARFGEGAEVRGKVMRLQQYGAFVELMPGVEGLLHISRLGADRRVQHPSEVLRVGDEIDVTVLEVKRDERRISLGRKAVEDAAAASAAEVEAYRPKSSGLGTFADLLKKK